MGLPGIVLVVPSRRSIGAAKGIQAELVLARMLGQIIRNIIHHSVDGDPATGRRGMLFQFLHANCSGVRAQRGSEREEGRQSQNDQTVYEPRIPGGAADGRKVILYHGVNSSVYMLDAFCPFLIKRFRINFIKAGEPQTSI